VIGGCFDIEFKVHSLALFEEFKTGIKRLLLSDLVLLELQRGGKAAMQKLAEVPARYKTEVKSTVKAVKEC